MQAQLQSIGFDRRSQIKTRIYISYELIPARGWGDGSASSSKNLWPSKWQSAHAKTLEDLGHISEAVLIGAIRDNLKEGLNKSWWADDDVYTYAAYAADLLFYINPYNLTVCNRMSMSISFISSISSISTCPLKQQHGSRSRNHEDSQGAAHVLAAAWSEDPIRSPMFFLLTC